MKKQFISLEKETLHGDNGVPTYFIDLISVGPDGRSDCNNLRSDKNITEARKIAREEADKRGLSVEDETLPVRPLLEPELRSSAE